MYLIGTVVQVFYFTVGVIHPLFAYFWAFITIEQRGKYLPLNNRLWLVFEKATIIEQCTEREESEWEMPKANDEGYNARTIYNWQI